MREQPPEPSARPLRHLAVLLGRPPIAPAELGAPHLHPDLACEDQLLVRGQLASERLDATQFLAQDDERLELGADVDELRLFALEAVEREGCLDRGLHRAAARERAPPIMYP